MKRTLAQTAQKKKLNWSNHDEHEEKLFNFVPPLHLQRKRRVLDVIMDYAKSKYPEECDIVPNFRIIDVGCEKGAFFQFLQTELIGLKNKFNTIYTGIDISEFTLSNDTVENLRKFSMGNSTDLRSGSVSAKLIHENVLYPSIQLDRPDALIMIEVIEHIKPIDVDEVLPHSIFGVICPNIVAITTPNADFNVVFGMTSRRQFRHWDHKFEWTRSQFKVWCDNVVKSYPDYSYRIEDIGKSPSHPRFGGGSQMAVFLRNFPQPLFINESLVLESKIIYEKENLFLPQSEYDAIKKYLTCQMSFWAVERQVVIFEEIVEDSYDSMKEGDQSLSDSEAPNLGSLEVDDNSGFEVFTVSLEVIERIIKKMFPKANVDVSRMVEECCRHSIYFKFDKELRQIAYVIEIEEEEDEDEETYLNRISTRSNVHSLCDEFQEVDI